MLMIESCFRVAFLRFALFFFKNIFNADTTIVKNVKYLGKYIKLVFCSKRRKRRKKKYMYTQTIYKKKEC